MKQIASHKEVEIRFGLGKYNYHSSSLMSFTNLRIWPCILVSEGHASENCLSGGLGLRNCTMLCITLSLTVTANAMPLTSECVGLVGKFWRVVVTVKNCK